MSLKQRFVDRFFGESIKKSADYIIDKALQNIGKPYDPSMAYKEAEFSGTQKSDLLQIYENHTWGYASVYAIASTIAGIPRRVYELDPQDEYGDEILKGRLFDLVNSPNPLQSGYDLIEELISFLELTGDGYLEKNDPKEPTQLYGLRPDFVEIQPDPRKLIKGYIYKPSGVPIKTFQPDEVIHLKYFHPRSELYGIGAIEVLSRPFILDFNAITYQKKFFTQGGMINQYLTIKKSLSAVEFKRFKEEIRTEYGGVGRSHLPAVFDNEAELKDAGASPDKLMLGEQRAANRDEILSATGVPPIAVNLLAGKETYNNAQTQLKAFWTNTIIPKITKLQNKLNVDLFWPYNCELVFDLSKIEVLQENKKEKADTGKILIDSGQWTPNEVRTELWEKEAVEGGDTLRQPQAPSIFGSAESFNSVVKAATKKERTNIRKKEGIEFERLYNINVEKNYNVMRSLFKRLSEAVIDNITKNKGMIVEKAAIPPLINAAFAGLGKIEKQMIQDLIDVERDTVEDFLVNKYTAIKRIPPTQEMLSKIRYQIKENVDKWAKVSSDSIVSTMKDRVSNYLGEAIKNHDDIMKITSNIQQIFEGGEELTGREKFPWARAIARTETLKAGNTGKIFAMQEAGFESTEWIAGGVTVDDKGKRVDRETHTAADGEIQKIGDKFSMGLKYPGDPEGDVGELVNCRCTVTEA